MGKHRSIGLISLALALCLPAHAEERAINLDLYETSLLQAQGHPNEVSRWHGIWNFDNGRLDEARAYFERAASYGDKLSQHFLTLMYWNGEGVERDPAIAYVWADLAAERANNHDMLEMRERIWGELTSDQRRRALEIGPGYYAKYGDAAAQPRNDAAIRRFMRTQTGSRTGLLTSKLDVSLGRPDLWASGGTSSFGPVKSTGTEFYADNRTRPGAYWKAEDVSLKALLKQVGAGRVDVGEVKKVPEPTPATADDPAR